uniref:Small ribosomal subunit protein uS8c n=1 Tax=Eutreptia sp. CCAC 1914B TaxID=2979827 RepID=A0A977PJ97_9EUGL|nr:ribosomal protein S8 [Eutreptia sp. CCAC 1914B]
MVSDTVSDMILRIRNANLIKNQYVFIPKTTLTINIAKILMEEGFIEAFRMQEVYSKGKSISQLCIFLKYKGLKKKPYITALKRISKPGLRVYVSQKRIPRVLNGVGIAILSTTQGIMTDRTARSNKIGGEVLCYIW